MLKNEFLTALKSKRVIWVFFFLLALVIYDLYINYMQGFGEYLRGAAASKPTGEKLFHPCFASFLSSSTLGHFPQIMMKWAFPLYPLCMYSDSFALQKQYGYYNVLLTKADRKSVVFSRFAVAFLIPFFIMLIVLFLNFGLANIVFQGGTSFAGRENDLADATSLEIFWLNHPYAVYIPYIFIFAILAGFYSMFCSGLAFLVPKYIVLYPLAFFVWFMLLNMPYTILSLTHCFAYSIKEMVVPAIYYVFLVGGITVAAFVYKVRYDEL